MGKEGFDNENQIISYLNCRKFSKLNKNWRNFINYAFGNVSQNEVVKCEKRAGTNKSDISIKIGKITKTISIKSGIGNSVHQEPVDDFVSFLKTTYKIDNKLANEIRFFIWGDGTLNGTGDPKNRLSAPKFRKKFPKIIKNIADFFKINKRDLIKRFVIIGSKSKSAPDYIYYGNFEKGVWKSAKKVIDWLCDDTNESKGVIPVGRLTFQAWNRNINGGAKSENKRGVIQLKWASVGKDLKGAI
jgi:hypothetical protein